jgi:hypothetical protein
MIDQDALLDKSKKLRLGFFKKVFPIIFFVQTMEEREVTP